MFKTNHTLLQFKRAKPYQFHRIHHTDTQKNFYMMDHPEGKLLYTAIRSEKLILPNWDAQTQAQLLCYVTYCLLYTVPSIRRSFTVSVTVSQLKKRNSHTPLIHNLMRTACKTYRSFLKLASSNLIGWLPQYITFASEAVFDHDKLPDSSLKVRHFEIISNPDRFQWFGRTHVIHSA